MSDFAPRAPRPASRSKSYVQVEEFKHSGMEVALLVVGHDLSPRHPNCCGEGVVICAEPYHELSDMTDDGQQLLANDATLARLLAAPLTESGLGLLHAHVRAEHGATVVLPLFLDEADASAHTGVSLSAEPGDGVLVGVIFDRRDDRKYAGGSESSASASSRVRDELLGAVSCYREYLRGDMLLASVCGDVGGIWWTGETSDGDIDDLRRQAMQAADENAPEERAMMRELRQWGR